MKLVYLGPAGTFSERAARAFKATLPEEAELSPAVTLEELARAVAEAGPRSPTLAVMPYYNYLEGLVQERLDAIYENRLTIVGALRIPIDLALGKHSASRALARILSHPKALAQCSDFTRHHLPGLLLAPTSSTAAAAKEVAELEADYAIASPEALEAHQLSIVATDIGNRRHGRQNFTEFFVAGVRPIGPPPGHGRCHTVLAITPDLERPGVLSEILSQVAFYGLNILKIHSRPALERTDDPAETEPQMFYLEVVAHPHSSQMARCVEALRYRFRSPESRFDAVRVIGSFAEPAILVSHKSSNDVGRAR